MAELAHPIGFRLFQLGPIDSETFDLDDDLPDVEPFDIHDPRHGHRGGFRVLCGHGAWIGVRLATVQDEASQRADRRDRKPPVRDAATRHAQRSRTSATLSE